MKKRMVVMVFFLAISVILILFAVQERAFSASTPEQTDSEANMVFLPVVGKGLQSQFWVEIAALHRLIPQAGQPSEPMMSRTEWMAYLEAAFPTLIEAFKDIGAGGTRIYLSWADLEPDPPVDGVPQYNFNMWNWYDERLGEIGKAGIELIVTIADPPDWAEGSSPNPDQCNVPIDEGKLGEFARFLTDLVNHYKIPPYNVKRWELINEPDYTWLDGGYGHGCWGDHGAEYANMLSIAYPAIKAAEPNAFVLQGGIAYDWFNQDSYPPGTDYNFGPFYRYFPDDVMQAGGGEYIDALNFHYFPDFHEEWERWNYPPAPTCGDLFDGQGLTYYAGGIDLIAKTNHYRNRMLTCFGVDKAVWVTELAQHGIPNDPADLANQARYVIQGNVRGLAAGATNIVWYALASYDNFNQGLLNEDLTPKPAFYAFKTLTKELKGYEYQRALDSSSIEGYVFVSPAGQEKYVAWGSGSLTFESTSLLRAVDRYGNVTEIADGGKGDLDGKKNNVIVYRVSIDPSFLQPY